MDKPKNRRKTYRYFANLDIVKYATGQWFVRFPYKQEHIYISKELLQTFEKEYAAKVREFQKNPLHYFVDDGPYPRKILMPVDTLGIAVSILHRLLETGGDNPQSYVEAFNQRGRGHSFALQ